jgi:hypothetical protein
LSLTEQKIERRLLYVNYENCKKQRDSRESSAEEREYRETNPKSGKKNFEPGKRSHESTEIGICLRTEELNKDQN